MTSANKLFTGKPAVAAIRNKFISAKKTGSTGSGKLAAVVINSGLTNAINKIRFPTGIPVAAAIKKKFFIVQI